MSSAPIPIATAIELAHDAPETLASTLGHGALVGTPPADEDAPGWSFLTIARAATFSKAAPGIDLSGALVFSLRKVQPTFPGTLLIGRASSNDVCLDHHSISKLHARLRVDDEQAVLEDAGSRNGTQLNYVKLAGPRQLVDGDVVALGELVLRFYRSDAFCVLMRGVPRTLT